MRHFMKHHKKHISGYEFRESLAIFQRKVLEPWIAAERHGSSGDPGLKCLGVGRSRLCEHRLGRGQEENKQKKPPHTPPSSKDRLPSLNQRRKATLSR